MSARNDKNYKRKTLGQSYLETRDTQNEKKLWDLVLQLSDEKFCPNLVTCIDRAKNMFPDQDFYIHNAGKTEMLMTQVKTDYWIPCLACPSPNFSQIVFRYKHKEEQLEEIWCVPPEDACEYMIRNKNEVVPAERDLLAYVIAFVDGSLERMAKFLNGEKEDGPSLILEVQTETPSIITGE